MTDHDPFAELPRTATPPASIRARVIDDMRRQGLVRAGPAPLVSRLLVVAAAIALFAGGVWYGANRGPAPVPEGGTYALLLYEPDGFAPGAEDGALAAEYRDWAASLGDRFVAGEELGGQRNLGGVAGEAGPTGFFLVRADDWDAAMAIARDCPHLRHGGVVAVREVVRQPA
jgi:hypothetical protein